MRRFVIVAVGLLGILVGAVAIVPMFVPWFAERAGYLVGNARWCREGLCIQSVIHDGAVAERVTVGWDRVVRVSDVRVPRALLEKHAGGGGGSSTMIAGIEVDALVIDGTPLPTLSGTLAPERHLTGEGVTVDGDVVRGTVPTPVGELEVEAEPREGGVHVAANCPACTVRFGDEDAPIVLTAKVDGMYTDGALLGNVVVGDVKAGIEAIRVEGGDQQGLVATINLPPTPVESLAPLLAPLAPELSKARLAGTVHATAQWSSGGGLLAFDPGVEGLTVEGIVPPALAYGPFTYRVRDATDQEVFRQTGEGTADWVPLARMGRWLPAAVIAAEDAAFPTHPGYDMAGMREAAAKNAEAGAIVRGGSTLTQQLAKNLFLDGRRSYARKLRELLYAVELEQKLGKRRILELYLNVVEFGPGIYGAKAAADTYFLKDPEGLLPEEAAWLASILRNPRTAYRTQYLAGRTDTGRIGWILENCRGVPDAERDAAKARQVHLVPP